MFDKDGNIFDMNFFAQSLSADELLVRNEINESYPWELLHDLYTSCDDYFLAKRRFTNDVIGICITVADHIAEKLQKQPLIFGQAISKCMWR